MDIAFRKTSFVSSFIYCTGEDVTGTKHPTVLIALAVLILVGGGCQSEDVSSVSSLTEESRSLLDNAWAGRAERVPREILAIGGPSSDVFFGSIRGIAVDSNGQMYVADGEYHSVKVFSPSGELTQELGREGQGPGEFVRLTGLDVGARDSLFVLDSELNRITVYGLGEAGIRSDEEVEPAYIVQVPRPERPNGFAAHLMKPDTSGFLVGYQTGYPLPEGVSKRRWVGWFGSNGAVLSDTVAAGPGQPLIEGDIMTEHPFGTKSVYRLGADGKSVVGGHTDSLVFRKHLLSGRSIPQIRLPHRRIPLTEAHMKRHVDGMPGPVREKLLDAMRNTEVATQPAFRDFMVDGEERLWIDVTGAAQAKSIWLVVGHGGEILTTYSFPDGVRLQAVVQEMVYGVRSRESGASEIVVYRTGENA